MSLEKLVRKPNGIEQFVQRVYPFVANIYETSQSADEIAQRVEGMNAEVGELPIHIKESLDTTRGFMRQNTYVKDYLMINQVSENDFLKAGTAQELLRQIGNMTKDFVLPFLPVFPRHDAIASPIIEGIFQKRGENLRLAHHINAVPILSNHRIATPAVRGLMTIVDSQPQKIIDENVKGVILYSSGSGKRGSFYSKERIITTAVKTDATGDIADEETLTSVIKTLFHETAHSFQDPKLFGIVQEVDAMHRAKQSLYLLSISDITQLLRNTFSHLSPPKTKRLLEKYASDLELDIWTIFQTTVDEETKVRLMGDHNIRPYIPDIA